MKTNKFKTTAILMVSTLLLLIFVSCGSSNSSTTKDISELKQLVNSGNFEIEHDWANPAVGGQINLIGNSNHIKFHADSVDVFLPYFGERYSGGGYNGDGGIKYEGIAKDFEIIENNGKENIELKFESKSGNEKFNFFIIIFPNKKVNTTVNSSERSIISYQGKISKTEKD